MEAYLSAALEWLRELATGFQGIAESILYMRELWIAGEINAGQFATYMRNLAGFMVEKSGEIEMFLQATVRALGGE